MKIKNGYMMRKVADKCVVVPMGDEVTNFNGMINLNETGELLFATLQKGCTREELIEAMLAEYDISREICERDVDRFIEKVDKVGILEK